MSDQSCERAPQHRVGAASPDPAGAGSIDDLVHRMRELRRLDGCPSYAEIVRRVAALRSARGVDPARCAPGRVTVYDCFRLGRRRIDADLLCDIAAALGYPAERTPRWHDAYAAVSGHGDPAGRAEAHGIDGPPPALAGRAAELRLLCEGFEHGTRLLTGMPGVGKTALALRAAGLLPGRGPRPGPRLRVDLTAGGDGGERVEPAAAQHAVLRRCGVPAARLRHLAADERTALYRSVLARHDALLLLDDAVDEDQVRPLLPGPGPARVLVTSRRRLPGLSRVARLPLAPLTEGAALDLLAGACGERRLRGEPAAAARITARCGHLPLALAAVADRIARTPDWSLADHAGQDVCLDPVRRALDRSARRVSPGHRRLLALTALGPGPRITVGQAALLAALTTAQAGAALRRLADEHLLAAGPDGTYTAHPVVHAYARGLLLAEVSPTEQRRALRALSTAPDQPATDRRAAIA